MRAESAEEEITFSKSCLQDYFSFPFSAFIIPSISPAVAV
jgi:hypothetical protein